MIGGFAFPSSKLARYNFILSVGGMSDGFSSDEKIEQALDDRRQGFLKACQDQEFSLRFLAPEIAFFSGQVNRLKDQWIQRQSARVTPFYQAPPAACSKWVREENLNAWRETSPAEVYSIDIFDTCLVRLLPEPRAIFDLLGEHVSRFAGIGAHNFSRLRHEVENRLRQDGLAGNVCEDITIDAIYRAISDHYGWSPAFERRAMAIELALETFFLRPVLSVRDRVIKLYQNRIPIVYTSEMYWPAGVLRHLLQRNGFPTRQIPLFASGDRALSKGTGNLFRLIQKEFPRKCILHIGDNPVSDGEVPLAVGFHSAVIQTRKAVFTDTFSNVLNAASTSQAAPDPEDYWTSFGFRVAGPVHLAFATSIFRRSAEMRARNVFFLSRDGWFPQQVFQRLQERWGTGAEDRYLHSSREFFGIGSITDIGDEEWNFLLKPSPFLRTGDVFERLGISAAVYGEVIRKAGLPDPEASLCHHWGFRDPTAKDRLYEALCQCLPVFLGHRDQVRERLLAYLEAMGVFKNPSLFVDVGWSGSSAKAFRKLSSIENPEIEGHYFGLFSHPVPQMRAFFTQARNGGARESLLKGSVALMEFIFGSPEPTVRCMEFQDDAWEPVFRKPWSAYEIEAWTSMERGLLAYVDEVLEILGGPPDSDGTDFVEDTLRRLIFDPTPLDLASLGRISHAEGWGTDHRIRLLPDAARIDSESRYREALCYAPWKPGLQALMRGNCHTM